MPDPVFVRGIHRWMDPDRCRIQCRIQFSFGESIAGWNRIGAGSSFHSGSPLLATRKGEETGRATREASAVAALTVLTVDDHRLATVSIVRKKKFDFAVSN